MLVGIVEVMVIQLTLTCNCVEVCRIRLREREGTLVPATCLGLKGVDVFDVVVEDMIVFVVVREEYCVGVHLLTLLGDLVFLVDFLVDLVFGFRCEFAFARECVWGVRWVEVVVEFWCPS